MKVFPVIAYYVDFQEYWINAVGFLVTLYYIILRLAEATSLDN